MLDKNTMVSADQALSGRDEKMSVDAQHFVSGNPIAGEIPAGFQQAMFGLGCFWGAERRFWQQAGVYSTAVGYAAGFTVNPNYDEVCSGLTGHNEVVRVVFDPEVISYQQLLALFWSSHNPTQGMRQGNDGGTQYRSGIYTFGDIQQEQAEGSREHYQKNLAAAGQGDITTEIQPATAFYYAESYHQQYLAKNPGGYCGLGGLNISY